MSDPHRQADHDTSEQPDSKSQRKRDAHALTRLGSQLIKLPDSQLRRLCLPEDVADAVASARNINSRSAGKRARQYLGKRLRRLDQEAIEALQSELESLADPGRSLTAQQHRLEAWRDALLDDPSHLTELKNAQPVLDVQRVRQLLRAADREARQSKPPAAARKLFRYLRELDQTNPLPPRPDQNQA